MLSVLQMRGLSSWERAICPFPGGMSRQRRHRNPGLCDSAQCLSGMPHRFPGYLEIWRAGDAVRDFRMPVQMWIVAPAELTHVSLSPKPTSTVRGKSSLLVVGELGA